MPKLSIITINYNNLKGLKRTVESVINQTWQEFEYIIIDGGSTDGSTAYIESQNDNIDYWVSEPDKGIYNAMNKGIDKATGEYLLFLNSGDHFYNNNVLEENHRLIAEYDLIYFDVDVIGDKKSWITSYPEKLSFYFFYSRTICHQSTIIKRELFNTVGLYDENLKIVSDWKFFILALFKYNCSYLKIDAILSKFYLDGISADLTNQKRMSDERQEVLNVDFKNIFDDFKSYKEMTGVLSSLRKSRKIDVLVKLGLINRF